METESKDIGKEILIKLAKLQSDVDYLREHVKDEDTFLNEEEENLLEESYENEKNGKLVSSKKLREELKI
jgi:hypothetical protein